MLPLAPPIGDMRVSPSRESVERLEAHLLQLPQVSVKTEHSFAAGLYIRQITLPADTYATGAACLAEHLSVMVRGRMRVLADGRMQELSGFHRWIAPAGVKRVGYAVEETVWFTVHPNPTDERDIDRLEAMLFEQPDDLLRRRLEDGRAIAHESSPCLL